MSRYLIRLDDASPYMDKEKWERVENILDKCDIRPLVGIIPANADKEIMVTEEDVFFWKKPIEWKSKGWSIALHGYDHIYVTDKPGINPMWNRSEFAGLPLAMQKEKIRKGVEIIRESGVEPEYFFAPSHTFDEMTLEALKQETNIRIISDTIALRPYKKGDFVFIPQISGHCVKMPISGVYTFCFHPNSMNDKDFYSLDNFVSKNRKSFISFSDINITSVGEIGIMDRIARFCYFTLRKMKGLK